METGETPKRCVGCGAPSPDTETVYTLISARFGWRLRHARRPDGTVVVEFRCPGCWARLKAEAGRG